MRRLAPVFTLLVAALAPLVSPATATAQAPGTVKFLRYAAIANDGTIAFTYHDDIWLANNDGSLNGSSNTVQCISLEVPCIDEENPTATSKEFSTKAGKFVSD